MDVTSCSICFLAPLEPVKCGLKSSDLESSHASLGYMLTFFLQYSVVHSTSMMSKFGQ